MFYIAGVKVENPSEIKIGQYDISKSSRTAAGKMVMEIIATKIRVDVTWKMLPDAEFKKILDLITANKPFFNITFPYAGGNKTIRVYCGDISATIWEKINGIRYWQEVSIPFIEQ